MIIRLCKPEDEAVWIQLNREFMEFEIQDGDVWNDTQETSDQVFSHTFREALENPNLITLFLVEEEGQPIGFATLMAIYSVWAHGKAMILDDLYIKKEFQGRGAGRQIVEFIENHAREAGYKRLQFQSEVTNPGAKKFYEALGFKPNDMYFYVKYL